MFQRRPSAHPRRLTIALVLLCAPALAPAVAQAGVGAGAAVTFPTTVTVGQTGLPAAIAMTNFNTTPNSADTNTVCNAGEASPPCSAGEQGIVLVPACKQIAGGQCTVAGADPGVFAISATGTGAVGSSCAGVVFDTAVVDPTYGTVRFVPRPAGAHVTLPGFGATCTVNFTFSVVKSPTGDQDPVTPGTQTAQATEHTQFAGQFSPSALNNFARATSNGTTVLRAGPPTIATVASGSVPVAGQLTDQATVTGLVNPVAGATVTFRLYPPADATCSGTPVFTSIRTVALSGSTATATSEAYTPTAAGVYRWVATYGGDANNLPATGICNTASENVTVTAPCTPPPGPPPPGGVLCAIAPPPPPPAAPIVCTPPPGPAPAGGVLCARGTAAIRGRTGCQGSPFRVDVTGRQISRVTFSLDGRVVRTLTRPNSGSRYRLAVDPRRLRGGVHRVTARTVFTRSSGTRARTLRVTFSRCARRASAPAFTG